MLSVHSLGSCGEENPVANRVTGRVSQDGTKKDGSRALFGTATLPIAQLSRNQFFGEVELFGGEGAIATVRAGASHVELGMLSRDRFFALIQESPATASLLSEVAETRRRENLAHSQPGRLP